MIASYIIPRSYDIRTQVRLCLIAFIVWLLDKHEVVVDPVPLFQMKKEEQSERRENFNEEKERNMTAKYVNISLGIK